MPAPAFIYSSAGNTLRWLWWVQADTRIRARAREKRQETLGKLTKSSTSHGAQAVTAPFFAANQPVWIDGLNDGVKPRNG